MDALSPYYGVQDDGVKQLQLYVIHWSNMPAILVESAFLSNSYERGLLSNPTFRWRLAKGIADGIDDFLASNPFTMVWPRTAGADRYETAAAMAHKTFGAADKVILATGEHGLMRLRHHLSQHTSARPCCSREPTACPRLRPQHSPPTPRARSSSSEARLRSAMPPLRRRPQLRGYRRALCAG